MSFVLFLTEIFTFYTVIVLLYYNGNFLFHPTSIYVEQS